MMTLKDFELILGKKEIFKNSYFQAYPHQLTLIKGESGSGKTSLLKCLNLDYSFKGRYVYDEIDISMLSDDEKKKYKQTHICMVEQLPSFINDLTIEAHYQLYNKNYLVYDQYDSINLLQINNLMKEYPHQLSEGEKKRVAISLALLRDTPILIIDEPTASLNEEMSEIIAKLLHEYAQKGHTVIISSHDLKLQNYSDAIYNIDNLKLNLVLQNKETSIVSKNEIKKIQFSNNNYFMMFKHYISHKKLSFIMNVILISFVGLSCIFNNTVISVHKSIINNLSSKQVIVYKSNNKQLFDYSYNGFEYPITTEETEKLKSIDHVKAIHWKYDTSIVNGFNEKGGFFSGESEVEPTNERIKVFDHDQLLYTGLKDYESVIPNIIMSSFDDSENENIEFASQKNKQGIYLSKYLAEKITDHVEELIDKTIQIPIFIPSVDMDGISFQTTESGEEYAGNTVGAKKIELQLPIVGITKADSLYDIDKDSGFIYRYFVSQSILEEYRKENSSEESYYKYFVLIDDKMETFINEVPEEKKQYVTQKIKYTSWKPNCYVLEIDDLTHLSDVMNAVNEIGLNAKHIYLNSKSLQESVQSMQRIIQLVGGCLLALLLITQYHHKKQKLSEENEMRTYLRNMGLTEQNIRKIFMNKYLLYTLLYSIICIIGMIIETIVLNQLMYGKTQLTFISFFMIIFIVLIIEMVYPLIVKRRDK